MLVSGVDLFIENTLFLSVLIYSIQGSRLEGYHYITYFRLACPLSEDRSDQLSLLYITALFVDSLYYCRLPMLSKTLLIPSSLGPSMAPWHCTIASCSSAEREGHTWRLVVALSKSVSCAF